MPDLFGPPPLDQWPAELVVLFYERWGIKQHEGGIPEMEARRQEFAETWERRGE
jgi:hypothetical protein